MRLVLALASVFLYSCAGSWHLQENNDFFKPVGNNDEKYTQGARLTYREGDHDYYVGQSIYTPSDKKSTEPLPDQRPYAGYLYAGYTRRFVRTPRVFDSIGASVGVVGPSALGEQAQNEVHRLIGQNTAKGWRNQLKDEPAVVLTAERTWHDIYGEYVDGVSTLGCNLGNVFTQVYSSYKVRAGYNLPPVLVSGSPIFPRNPRSGLSVYVFGEALERAVARNIFLDGNTFRESASIEKKPFVTEGRVGISVERGQYAVRYILMFQTEEYEGEGSRNGFGEVSVSW